MAAEPSPYLPLVAPLIALAINVIAQVARVRQTRGSHFMQSIIAGFLAGAAALAALEFLPGMRAAGTADAIAGIAVRALTYGALSYCYFNFVNLGQSSIRIRIYAEIAAAPAGLTARDLASRYHETSLMAVRLHRLTESGDIIEKNGRYFIGRNRMVPIANLIFAAKQLILARRSEFE